MIKKEATNNEYIWIGSASSCATGSGIWDDPANWSTGIVPNGPDVIVTIFVPYNRGKPFNIRLNASYTVGTLNIQGYLPPLKSSIQSSIYLMGNNLSIVSAINVTPKTLVNVDTSINFGSNNIVITDPDFGLAFIQDVNGNGSITYPGCPHGKIPPSYRGKSNC